MINADYIPRLQASGLLHQFDTFPVVAIIGSRQTGKSTLARHFISQMPNTTCLDLELDSDLAKLDDAELFLTSLRGRLVCIDEIQRKPELFPLLRALVDRSELNLKFLILGSASPELLRQSSESLAGRIQYMELAGFLFSEVMPDAPPDTAQIQRLWLRGGYPRSYLAASDSASFNWRRAFMRTFVERDIPQLGYAIQTATLSRFWSMAAHYHGQVFNASRIGESLGVSHTTTRKYLDLFEHTFALRVLPPFLANTRKRMVKSPKIYVRDSGLLHALMGIESMEQLFGHPVFGSSWEGWVIDQIIAALPHWRPHFYRTASGEEIDLIMVRGGKRLAFEIKASLSPRLSKGIPGTLEVLKPEMTRVICPMDDAAYPIREDVQATGIRQCLDELKALNQL